MLTYLFKTRPLRGDISLYSQHTDRIARLYACRSDELQTELELKKLAAASELKDLDKTVQLLDQIIDQNKKLVIIGDYDADGATSTTLMMLVLTQLGANVDYLIPDRFKYGYGLTPEIVTLAQQKFAPDWIITVDNGISSHEGVATAKKFGMGCIITDHHLTTKKAPAADAVVNPNQLGCCFPSKSLVGVGVAFYVLAALSSHRKAASKSFAKLTDYLDLVALGTVADVGQLDFNNRILVDAGLKRIRQGLCRPGISALLELADKAPQQLKAQDLGFTIGPRLNAAGRLESMHIGVECLLTDDIDVAFGLAQQLNQLNLERRQVESEMKQQALALLEMNTLQINDDRALVLYDAAWHQGVIGIVAGRLKDQYHRPTIVFAPNEDGLSIKGSARSIEGVHIRDAIESVANDNPHLITHFGGHAAAAGLTLATEHFDAFKTAFLAVIQQLNPQLFDAVCWTDGELANEEINLDTWAMIEAAGPWGHGFEPPLFEGVFLVKSVKWLQGKHLKLELYVDQDRTVDAIAFSVAEQTELLSLQPQQQVHVAYQLENNYFRQQNRLQLMLRHVFVAS